MSIFSFPFSHNINITQSTTFGYLNPPSKASGIAVVLFQLCMQGANQEDIEEFVYTYASKSPIETKSSALVKPFRKWR